MRVRDEAVGPIFGLRGESRLWMLERFIASDLCPGHTFPLSRSRFIARQAVGPRLLACAWVQPTNGIAGGKHAASHAPCSWT
jgi:hypothetical protein